MTSDEHGAVPEECIVITTQPVIGVNRSESDMVMWQIRLSMKYKDIWSENALAFFLIELWGFQVLYAKVVFYIRRLYEAFKLYASSYTHTSVTVRKKAIL